jgi:hypothetical protein
MMAKPEESQKYAIGAKQLYTLWSAFAVPMEVLAELIFGAKTEHARMEQIVHQGGAEMGRWPMRSVKP